MRLFTLSFHNVHRYLLIGLLSLLSVTAYAQQKDAWELVLRVKTPAPKVFFGKVANLARAIQPGMMTEMMFMPVAPAGYPDFKGIAEDTPVSFYLFKNTYSEDYGWFACVQGSGESLLVQNFQEFFPPQTKRVEKDGWQWFSHRLSPESFDATWLAMMQADNVAPYDAHVIDVMIEPKGMPLLADDLKMAFLLGMEAPLGADMPALQQCLLQGIDQIAKSSQRLSILSFALDITEDDVVLLHHIAAEAGTPEAAALKLQAVEASDLARFVSGDYPIGVRTRMDYRPFMQYAETFLSGMLEGLDGTAAQWVQAMIAWNKRYMDADTGETTAGIGFVKPGTQTGNGALLQVQYESFSKTSMTHDQLVEAYQGLDFIEVIMKDWLAMTAPSMISEYRTQVEPQAWVHREIPVLLYTVEHSMEPDPEQFPEQMLELQKNLAFSQTQNVYMAIVGDTAVQANREEHMRALIDRLLEGKAIEPNLSQALSFDEDEYLVGTINLAAYMAGAMGSAGPMLAPMVEAMEKVSDQSPAKVSMRQKDTLLTSDLTIPISSVRALMQAFASLTPPPGQSLPVEPTPKDEPETVQ